MSENQVFHLWRRPMGQTPPRIYREDPAHEMPRKFLTEEVYAQAIEGFVIVCTDAAVINRARRTIYLACRTVKPMQGIWWIGGRRFAGEAPEASVSRCFKRETGLDLPEDRFVFVFMSEYLWKDRQQEPQGVGSDNLCHTYAVELTDEELAHAAANLDPHEYDCFFGLKEFTREKLVAAGVHPVILDFYDAVFGAVP